MSKIVGKILKGEKKLKYARKRITKAKFNKQADDILKKLDADRKMIKHNKKSVKQKVPSRREPLKSGKGEQDKSSLASKEYRSTESLEPKDAHISKSEKAESADKMSVDTPENDEIINNNKSDHNEGLTNKEYDSMTADVNRSLTNIDKAKWEANRYKRKQQFWNNNSAKVLKDIALISTTISTMSQLTPAIKKNIQSDTNLSDAISESLSKEDSDE